MRQHWVILDWAGNDIFNGLTFLTFDDAEDFLCQHLKGSYDVDRQEYEIVRTA